MALDLGSLGFLFIDFWFTGSWFTGSWFLRARGNLWKRKFVGRKISWILVRVSLPSLRLAFSLGDCRSRLRLVLMLVYVCGISLMLVDAR